MSDKGTVFNGNVTDIISRLAAQHKKYDIIFMDPPYSKNFIVETLKVLAKNDIIKKNGIIVAEHDTADNIPKEIGVVKLAESRKYGDTVLAFYKLF